MPKIGLRSIASLLIFICQFVIYLGCSGSGGDGLFAGGGIGGTGITVGSVSGFGSVIVIDDEYDTETAEIIVEGELIGVGDEAVINNLDIGKVVQIEGSFADDPNRTATRVVYNDNVEGPVDLIGPIINSRKALIVMGQPVIIDENTNFKNTSFDDIALGNVIEVSGLVDFNFDFGGSLRILRATFVEKKAEFLLAGETVDLKGIVQDLNDALKIFDINLLEIDYRNILDSDLPEEVPANGQLVEIKGTLSGGTLVADQITLENELGTDNADFIEIEGFVTVFNSILDFTFGNLLVETDEITIFEDLSPDEIALGKKLVIKGELIDGVLFADRVRLPF